MGQPRVVRIEDGVVGRRHLHAGVSEQDLRDVDGAAVGANHERHPRLGLRAG